MQKRTEPLLPAIAAVTQLPGASLISEQILAKALDRAATEHSSRIQTMNQQGRARINSPYWTFSSAQRTNGVNENEVGSCAG